MHPAVHNGFVHAYAASLHTVFLSAVPIAGVAFVLTCLLKEVPLRRLVAARRTRLVARLGNWADEQDARLAQKLDELARDLIRDPVRRHRLVTSR